MADEGEAAQDKDKWICRANDAISIRLVGNAEELDGLEPFHPTYTHQVFRNDETIQGYTDLEVELSFNASTLQAHLDIRNSGKNRLGADDIEGPLNELLPDKVSLRSFKRELGQPFSPAGAVVHSYTRQGEAGGTFDVYWASFEDEQAQAHNGRLSLFVLMFIDGSSVIDASDTRWHTFTTYKRGATAAEPPRVVAYTTVYPFVAMVGGELVERYRLSQILVLPPYQRGGHGSALLQVVYAEGLRRGSFEIAIEDPGPAMVLCRLVTDCRNCLRERILPDPARPAGLRWSDQPAFVEAAKRVLRITAVAANACFEAVMLSAYPSPPLADDEQLKDFRLAVKRRLYREDPNLVDMTDTERKLELQTRYLALVERYELVIKSASLRDPRPSAKAAGGEAAAAAVDRAKRKMEPLAGSADENAKRR